MKIIEVNWGIANRFQDGTIEINKHLKEDPELYKSILRHELDHDDSTFSWKDFKHDLYTPHNKKINQWNIMRFVIRHPKALTQLLPIYYSKKRGFVLDLNFTILYLFLFGIIGLSLFIGLKIF